MTPAAPALVDSAPSGRPTTGTARVFADSVTMARRDVRHALFGHVSKCCA